MKVFMYIAFIYRFANVIYIKNLRNIIENI